MRLLILLLLKKEAWHPLFYCQGTVTAKNEQYVYFDASKGDLDEILVSVGDKVSEGQALVKYSSSEAQAAYDSASQSSS